MINRELFDDIDTEQPPEQLATDFWLFHSMALNQDECLLKAVDSVLQHSPLRHMITPGGFTMSAAMSNCGEYGWVTDRRGYRYTSIDPVSGEHWPVMPDIFRKLSEQAATLAGFNSFSPDACLINSYQTTAKMSLHQDKNEADYSQPVVSVSLGVSAIFLLGGMQRNDKTQKIFLKHGDVMVWGGESRLRYHGILPIKSQYHPLTGEKRINITFRKAR